MTCIRAFATGDLFAPVDLEVVDVEATVAIATKAGERVPIVLVRDDAAAPAVVAAFDAAFRETRARFLDRLEAVLGARALPSASVASTEFRQFRADFQAENALVPVGPGLAQTWARGFDGEPVRERIAAHVLAIERDLLIGDIRPASSVFVVTVDPADAPRTWGEVAARARAVAPGDVLSVAAAGEQLRRTLDPLDRAAEGYLSGLLRANIAEDRFLTGLLLRDRLGERAVRHAIPAGTQLVNAGRVVDPWAELALVQLARIGTPATSAPPGPATPEGDATTAPTASAGADGAPRWMGPILSAGGGLLASLVVILLVRHRRAAGGEIVARPDVPRKSEEAMIPHLARELKDRLVRALFTQRSVLLANEQAASRRVQEMEERLARLQPAIAERIRSYEDRIEALEREIAQRDADTRELLRAKLVLARRELDAEIARNRIDWN